MKNKVYINYNFEERVDYFLKKYLEYYGGRATLINGRSRSKTYGGTFTDYQVKIWQTKTLINVEVMR